MKDKEEMEAEANLFAMHLLMPESLVISEMKKLLARGIPNDLFDDRLVNALAKKFAVSTTIMALRLGQIPCLRLTP